ALIILVMFVAPVLAAPQLPAAFYGDASINGRPVPSGSVITAEINGLQKGTLTTTVEGKYGSYYASEGKLYVYDGKNGDQILFYIQTSQMANKILAAQKGAWIAGSNQKLDLTFSGVEVLKPAGSTGAPSGGSGGGGGGGGSSGSGTASTRTVTNPDDGTKTTVTTTEANEQGVQNTVQDLGNNLLSLVTVEVTLTQGDSALFNLYKKHELKLKVLGSDAAIITVDGANTLVNFDESVDVDLNEDEETDLKITLTRIAGNKATFELTKLAAVSAPAEGAAITGLAFGDSLNATTAMIVVAIIIIILVAYFLLKKFRATPAPSIKPTTVKTREKIKRK
ncbi:MAG: hypothetical protein HY513_05670, partial [Candidatus Aenigmarchaeota archaeon]|nr:hypothetical protein [Candidatus Aenigmarchaeota archaeon]